MPQAAAQLPWWHISLLIHKVKDESSRHWYGEQVIEQGWSRPTLERYVKEDLYQRQAIPSKKASNYLDRLPSPQSVLAQELLTVEDNVKSIKTLEKTFGVNSTALAC